MPAKPARSHSLLKRLLIWSGPFVVVMLLTAYGVRYWRASTALEAEIQRIRDRGEPLRLEELLPEIDPEEDAGPLLREALQQYQSPDEEFFVLLAAVPATPPGDYRAFREALTANQKTLELLAQAVEKPHCRLASEDHKPTSQIHLSELLYAQCLQSLGTGDDTSAVTAIIQGLKLNKLIRDDPFTLSQITGHSMTLKSLNSLQEYLGKTKLSESDFEQIDSLLNSIRQNSFLKPSIFAERAMIRKGFEYQLAGGEPTDQIDPPVQLHWWDKPIIGRHILVEAQTVSMRWMTEIADVIDEENDNATQTITTIDNKIRNSPYFAINFFLVGFWSGLRADALLDRQRMILARFALRVDRYRRQHGELPQTLAQVCDQQLPLVPPDLLQRKPLLYETHEQGFVIGTRVDSNIDQEISQECRFEVLYPDAGDLQDAADLSTQE